MLLSANVRLLKEIWSYQNNSFKPCSYLLKLRQEDGVFAIYILLIGRLNGLFRVLWEAMSELEVAQCREGDACGQYPTVIDTVVCGSTSLCRNHRAVVTSSQ